MKQAGITEPTVQSGPVGKLYIIYFLIRNIKMYTAPPMQYPHQKLNLCLFKSLALNLQEIWKIEK